MVFRAVLFSSLSLFNSNPAISEPNGSLKIFHEVSFATILKT